ncbi:hypothetical protein LMH87_006195 [Akanthomyces muscarius]|uniref:AB hydrolase-1 domain-containing protein n=1 Tax=Akanthomyces muscarius TaxID=2231603 RepID=A0A9W8QM92_AKAMU|nr:hypothetical protein LMH87_006195 [Akanthomyces muscarius]KAJ4164523.1 hypothetical protein LMH87_006195 [Akanthomyces muscarius]
MEAVLSSQEFGDGLPILIIHGWELSGRADQADFEPVFAKLAGLRRIYVDLPGMGSTPGNNVQHLDGIFDHIVQFIDVRLAKSRFLVVGSSCGGYLARAVAQKYADQVDGLLLRVPLIEPKDSRRDLDPITPLVEDAQLMSTVSDSDRSLLGDLVIQTSAYISALKNKILNVYHPAEAASDSKVLSFIRDDPERYQLSWSLDDPSAKFLAPTLILCGRHDDSVGYRDSLRLLELYPRSTYAVLDRATHALPVDETGVFEALVGDWIKRVHEWRDNMTRAARSCQQSQN